MNSLQSFKRVSLPNSIGKAVVLVLLLGLLLFATLPNLLKGDWTMVSVPEPQNLSEIRTIREEGIQIPAPWEEVAGGKTNIGGHEWSAQEVVRPASQPEEEEGALILLLPMRNPRQRPQVEWTDWQASQGLTLDGQKDLDLTAQVGDRPVPFSARLSRGWNDEQETFAMLQWYAWPGGGSPDLSDWFLADRRAQLRGQRLPWVAVNLVSKTDEPLDELANYQERLVDLAVDVQSSLEIGPLHPDKLQSDR